MSAGRGARLVVAAAFAAGAFALLVWWIVWARSASQMRLGVEEWASAQREAGFDVVFDEVRTKGFPFLLRGEVSNVSISDAAGRRWSVAALYVDALPYAPDRRIISASNPQAFDLGAHGLWSLEAKSARISFDKPRDREWIVDIESGPGAFARADGSMRIEAARFLMSVAPKRGEPERIEASLMLEGGRAALGEERIDAPRFELFIEAGDGEKGREIIARRIAGTLEGSEFAVAGAIGFDVEDRPAGVLEAEIAAPQGLAEFLRKTGALTRAEADQAGAALALAAIAGGGRLKGPIELKDGAASVAGVEIAKFVDDDEDGGGAQP